MSQLAMMNHLIDSVVMTLAPDPVSLDAETGKPLQFRIEGDEEWSVIAEVDALEAFRESKIPSSTLFRRGEGVPRTLATLLSWNGKECPFADFSLPVKREGGTKSASDASMDENRGKTSHKGGEETNGVFTRFVAYMDNIQGRIDTIEKMQTEQQSRLDGAEVFMKKVASLDVRANDCEAKIKKVDRSTQEVHEFIFCSKRPPLGQNGEQSSLRAAEMDEMFVATKKIYNDLMGMGNELSQFKEEVRTAHDMEKERGRRVELLDDRYEQLISLLAASKRDGEVREALQEWNDKRKAIDSNGASLVPLPKTPMAFASVSTACKLDWRSVQEDAANEVTRKGLIRAMRSQMPPNTTGKCMLGLLLGRENIPSERDREATLDSIQKLAHLGTRLTANVGSKLSDFMGNPRFMCICGANLQSGIAVLTHCNASKHTKVRPYPVYQSDIDYWTTTVNNLQLGPRARIPTLTSLP